MQRGTANSPETNGEVVYGLGRQPAILHTISQRLIREFSDTINGFNDDGWSILNCDDAQDIAVAVNSSKNLSTNTNTVFFVGRILQVKASMLLQMDKLHVLF
ncbi:unnamed protein product [Fraxinus pennsylvanica]|uniref:Uncharacterized protein n=1 Tax=Fraxinus pennsylvanica TaxID=56036 RepID=A0AAD2DSK0_9LAMI|nr:unnamed protein product [Fraxinus pennsylvanica]